MGNVARLFGRVDWSAGKGVLVILGFVLFFGLGFYFFGGGIVGEVVLNLDADYREGENLDGVLRLSLSSGEFVPAASKVVFEGAGERREFVLRDILVEDSEEGTYYINGGDFSGEGEGYGLEGSREVYPEISFEFEVYSEALGSGGGESPEEEVVEEEVVNDSSSEEEVVVEEEVEEVVEEEIVEEEEELEIISITGEVALDIATVVSGSVFAGESFVYDLGSGQGARLVSGSVETSFGVIDDDDIMFEVSDGGIVGEVVLNLDADYREGENLVLDG